MVRNIRGIQLHRCTSTWKEPPECRQFIKKDVYPMWMRASGQTNPGEQVNRARLTDAEVNNKCIRDKKEMKRVHWREESQLAEIRYFDFDPEERANMSRMKEYFDHIGQCRGIQLRLRQRESAPVNLVKDATTTQKRKENLNCISPSNMANSDHAGVRRDTKNNQHDSDPTIKTTGHMKSRQISLPALWTVEEMEAAQEVDSDISLVMKAKQNGAPRPPWVEVSPLSKSAKTYWAEWDRLEVRNGILHRRWESNIGKVIKWQMVVPVKYI